jgi:predicted ATPase
VMSAADLVHDLLAAAPQLTVLVTSQAPLQLRDEHEYPLDPLGEEQAVKLFLARAQAVKPGFELTDENSEAVHAICRRLDGLPLALELAAARVKLLGPEAILRRLEHSLDLLTGGAADLPTRQRTLRDAIDWSYQLLEPAEQALLARLGVFAGGCSLELADAVAGEAAGVGDALDTLASLVDKSLVRQRDGSDGEPRFVLLETIREYALEQLEERGELEDLRRRYAERFLALVEAAEPELLRTNQAVWLERLDTERDNIRAALAWATTAGEVELALRMAGALVRFWSTRGLMREGRARLAEALASAEGVSPAILAKAHFAAGYAALGEGDFREARVDFERSLEQARAASDGQAEGAALAQIAWLAMAGGEAEEARSLAEQSSALAEQAGDNLVASGAATTLADVALAEGKLDDAIELFERGLTLRRGLGDRRLIANSLVGLGRAYLLRGDYERAAALFEEALGLAREVKDTWITSVALGHLARKRLLGDADTVKARELMAEALRLARDRNDRRLAAEWVQTLAVACVLEGSEADAARFAASAVALCETTGAEPYPAEELLQERFLSEVHADPEFAAALGTARGQPPEQLVAEATEAAGQRRSSSETVTSPGA